MIVNQELFYSFREEAIQELLNPVLHRVDITGLQPVQSRLLASTQKLQRSFIKGARRFYSSEGDFPDGTYIQESWFAFIVNLTENFSFG